jgi:hypothetical protein
LGDRGTAALVFALLSCVYLASSGGHFYTGDGIEMFKTAESILRHGDLAVRPGPTGRRWGYPGTDGKQYSPYALGLTLVELPFYAAGTATVAPLPLSRPARARLAQAAALSANACVTAATALVLFLLARAIGIRRRGAVGVALLYGLGTMAWVYSKHDFAEPLAALCLLGTVLCLVRADEGGRPGLLLLAGAFNGYSFFTKYQMIIYTPLLAAYLLSGEWRRRSAPAAMGRRLALFFAPGLLFGLANLFVNQMKFGTWLETGYARQGDIWAGLGFAPAGLLGLLLSPGKGLLWYSPLVIAVPFVWRRFHLRHARLSFLCAGITAATLAMFAPLWWWHGDWAWGPRYLVLVLPFVVLPLGVLLEEGWRLRSRIAGVLRVRHALAALVLLAILVNLLGLAVNFLPYLQALRDLDRVHDDWNFIPNLSPIRFHAHIVGGWARQLLGGEIPDFRYRAWYDGKFREQVIPMDAYARSGKVPDFFLFRKRDSIQEQLFLGAAGLALVVGAALLARRLRAALHSDPA